MNKIETVKRLKALYEEYTSVVDEIDRIDDFAKRIAEHGTNIRIYMEADCLPQEEPKPQPNIMPNWLMGFDEDYYMSMTQGGPKQLPEEYFEVRDVECLHILGMLLNFYRKRRDIIREEINKHK